MTDGKKKSRVAYFKFIIAFRRFITAVKRKPKGRSYFGDSEFNKRANQAEAVVQSMAKKIIQVFKL